MTFFCHSTVDISKEGKEGSMVIKYKASLLSVQPRKADPCYTYPFTANIKDAFPLAFLALAATALACSLVLPLSLALSHSCFKF